MPCMIATCCVMVGTDYPYSNFLPRKGNVIQIDVRAEALGQAHTDDGLGVIGSARPALKMLLDGVQTKTDGQFFETTSHARKKWDEMLDKQADPARSKNKIHPQAVARIASDLARPDAIFVFDTGLNTLWSANWIRQNGTQRIIGSFNNAAVGTSVGQGNGVQILDRSKQVIVLTGDGGFNMLMGEFMTAVQHKLPIKVIVYNNSALGLITLEAESIGLAPFPRSHRIPPIPISPHWRVPAARRALRPSSRAI